MYCEGVTSSGLIVKHAGICKAFSPSWQDRMYAKAIRELADKMERRIRASFLEGINALKDAVPLKEVMRALERGDQIAALKMVDEALDAFGFEALRERISEAVTAGGKVGAEFVQSSLDGTAAAPRGLHVRFDTSNPRTAAYVRQHASKLIRELSDEARRSVTRAMQQGLRDGIGPTNIARNVKGALGLTERQLQAVTNYRRLLEEGSPDALDRALRDRRFDATVARTVGGGPALDPKKIDNMVSRYQARMESYRALNVARTESMRAISSAQSEVWSQAVGDGWMAQNQVKRYWFYTADGKAREAHVGIPSLNPDGVGLDEPFDSELGPIMYPGDPAALPENTINCRCVVVTRYIPEV